MDEKNERRSCDSPASSPPHDSTTYDVKYSIIESKKIFNICGPNDLVYNDRYSHGEIYISIWNEVCDFYNRLEKSILTSGFRNPIVVNAGFLKPTLVRRTNGLNIRNNIFCHYLGGSRLYIAQKHNLCIPCIVSDFNNLVNGEILKTEDSIKDKFTDKPYIIRFLNDGVKISDPPPTHLPEGVDMQEIRRKTRILYKNVPIRKIKP